MLTVHAVHNLFGFSDALLPSILFAITVHISKFSPITR